MVKKKTVRKTRKRRTRVNHRGKIRDFFRKNPESLDWSADDVASKFGCHVSTVATAKREVRMELDGGDTGVRAEDIKAIMRMGVARAKEAIRTIEYIRGS